MLWSQRKQQEAMAAREAAGESLWTEQIDHAAVVRISEAWAMMVPEPYAQSEVGEQIARTLALHAGRPNAATHPEFFVNLSDTDEILDHIGAIHIALAKQSSRLADTFQAFVNKVFNDHRIKFRMVEGGIVPLASDELHVEVVEPVLRLLVDSRFAKAHAAYIKALKEISHGDAGDAITDAGTTLQETLTALGCSGNALGPLIADARKRGLLAPHDETLADGIEKFMHWASANRSQTGDAHKHSDATLDDAWLMVHIVGALILRLATGSPRTRQAQT